jgi:predicted Fe-Mo cluster-binding NifX family protein
MNDRVAISIEESSNGKETVAEHFGRCSKFKVCELDDDKTLIKTEIYFNPLVGEHNGACQLPGYVKQFNVSTIIAGGMGQKAVNNFLNYGINVITAPGLLFKDAFDLYLQGKLSGYEACKHEHHHH